MKSRWSCMPISAPPGRCIRDKFCGATASIERRGTANAFCGVEPKAGRHYPRVTPDRSSPEFADYLLEIVGTLSGRRHHSSGHETI